MLITNRRPLCYAGREFPHSKYHESSRIPTFLTCEILHEEKREDFALSVNDLLISAYEFGPYDLCSVYYSAPTSALLRSANHSYLTYCRHNLPLSAI